MVESVDSESDTNQQSSAVKSLVHELQQQQKEVAAKKEAENAERVDALLMELFPDRMDLFRKPAANGQTKGAQAGKKKSLGVVTKLKVIESVGILAVNCR